MKNLFDVDDYKELYLLTVITLVEFTPQDSAKLINLVEALDMAIAPLSNEALGVVGNSLIKIVVEAARIQSVSMPEHLLRRKQAVISAAFADVRKALREYGNTPAVGLVLDALGMCEQIYKPYQD